MPYPILASKLNLPRLRLQAIFRPTLIQRLDQGLVQRLPLSLVCAPAGYGKTTLVVEWLSHLAAAPLPGSAPSPAEPPVSWKTAWLSLDEQDDDPTRFLAYFAAAIGTVDPVTCKALLPLLESPQLPSLDVLASQLINELQKRTEPFIMVLDDVHWLRSEYLQRLLRLFVEHLPSGIHLVWVTREEPFLPLGRLRSRNLITELRTEDLRFDAEESAAFLNACTKLDLSSEWTANISQLTEGWAAGLQLAAFSLQGQRDYPAFMRDFRSQQHFVIDYLLQEVLSQLSPELRTFLFDTSILDRLSSPLCNAVTLGSDCQQVLELLEQKNLFLIPLDDEREWYRYHSLFADLLRHQLRLKKSGEEIGTLHRRTAEWFEKHGYISEALQHARAIPDWGMMEQIVLEHGTSCFRSGAINLLLEWMHTLPPSSFDANPQLCNDYGWALALTHQFDQAGEYFQQAEGGLQDDPNRLGMVLVGQAYVASFGDCPQRSIELAKRALDLLAVENLWMRSVCHLTLGFAYWNLFDLDQCEAAMQAVLRSGRSAAAGRNQATALAYLGHIQLIRLDFDAAQKLLGQAISPSPTGEVVPGSDLAYTYLAYLNYELNRLTEAQDWINKGVALSQLTGNVILEVSQYCFMGRIFQAMGNWQEAEAALQKAHTRVKDQPNRSRWFSANAAYQVEFDLARGDFASAERWARQIGGEIYFPFFAFSALARAHWLWCTGEGREADLLLADLYQKAQKAGWASACFRINLLRALSSPHSELARQILIDCLAQASPRGWVRPFLDLGEPMFEALVKANVRLQAPDLSDFVDQILFLAYPTRPTETKGEPVPPQSLPLISALVEPLSDREVEVLQLLSEEPNYEEIAQKLVVSTNTIKTHLKHIYGKLGVSSRREALARARELHLLHP